MSESNGVPDEDVDNLVTAEGVNERGTNREAAGKDPGERATGDEAPSPTSQRERNAGSTAPGSAVGEDHGALDAAPEPNEPA
jgi:hypothetical protein